MSPAQSKIDIYNIISPLNVFTFLCGSSLMYFRFFKQNEACNDIQTCLTIWGL